MEEEDYPSPLSFRLSGAGENSVGKFRVEVREILKFSVRSRAHLPVKELQPGRCAVLACLCGNVCVWLVKFKLLQYCREGVCICDAPRHILCLNDKFIRSVLNELACYTADSRCSYIVLRYFRTSDQFDPCRGKDAGSLVAHSCRGAGHKHGVNGLGVREEGYSH